MVNISKSGEEGYYPDLQKTAEERLRSLSPNNRHLRVEEPVLTRNTMNNEEWNSLTSEMGSWKKDIAMRDLRLTEENNNTMEDVELPPVRQPPPNKCAPDKKGVQTVKRGISDYAAWDKYDVDTELLKMDLEEEQEKEQRQRDKQQDEVDRLDEVKRNAESKTETERQQLAEVEKTKGNEFYEERDYTEAIKYYSVSIAIWATAKAYNNRAACYLKLCRYSAALEDANNTLALEPNNVKALFRRGVALQHKNMFREALADMNSVLRQQPKHLLAQHICRELREQILTMPKTVRIMTDEGLNKPKKIVEMNARDLTKESLAGNSYEVNEFGLPKVMCECTGTPRFLQLPRKCPMPHFTPRTSTVVNNARIVELSDPAEPPKNSTKLEIVEVEGADYSEDFFKAKKCVVVDKRTQKHVIQNNLPNGSSSTVTNGGDAGMDEDFELNCPLLDDVSEPGV